MSNRPGELHCERIRAALNKIEGTDSKLGVRTSFGVDKVRHVSGGQNDGWWVEPAIQIAPFQLDREELVEEIRENGEQMEVLSN